MDPFFVFLPGLWEVGYSPHLIRGQEGQINIRTPQTMVSGFSLTLGLGTRISDLYVYVVFWAPTSNSHIYVYIHIYIYM